MLDVIFLGLQYDNDVIHYRVLYASYVYSIHCIHCIHNQFFNKRHPIYR